MPFLFNAVCTAVASAKFASRTTRLHVADIDALRVTIIPVTIPGSLDRCVVDLIVHWSCDFPVTDWGLLRELLL